MREWPESRVVATLLARVTRRRLLQSMATGVAIALGVAAGLALVLLLSGTGAGTTILVAAAFVVAGGVIARVRLDTSEAASAAALEAGAPQCRNIIVTAAALLTNPGHTPPAVCRVVMYDAASVVGRLNPSALLPWSKPAGRLVAAALVFAAAFLVKVPGASTWLPDLGTQAASAPGVSDVRVTVTPPSYTGLKVEASVNPERIVALAGSRVDFEVSGNGAGMTMETADGAVAATRAPDGMFTAAMTVRADGFVSITPRDAQGVAGPRRLIGVSATPDRPPVPRVTLPGKDLFLREATSELNVAVDATDDLGLKTLKLGYTKVAGVGESFKFTEGELSLALTRTSSRQWSGTGSLNLASLALEVGDMIVYRAVAADARPGALPVESDAFIVEIVSASEAMSEGFAIDDTRDKYALSQQMVIVKTERLIAKAAARPAPTADVVREEALMIAAEQRSVRAELVFMMGGHFEDEFVEAAHEDEIAEGRMDNSGRADLGRAIRDMSRAAAELTDGNLKTALDAEKAALEAMQRALSRRRFILRTLTQRESIDDSRRLTGTLSELARTRRAVTEASVPPHVAALRDGLARLGELMAKPAFASGDADVLTTISAQLLKTAATDRAVVDVVAVLAKAGEAVAVGRDDAARTAMTDAAGRITTMLRQVAPPVGAGDDLESRRLKGALADAQRRGGGR